MCLGHDMAQLINVSQEVVSMPASTGVSLVYHSLDIVNILMYCAPVE